VGGHRLPSANARNVTTQPNERPLDRASLSTTRHTPIPKSTALAPQRIAHNEDFQPQLVDPSSQKVNTNTRAVHSDDRVFPLSLPRTDLAAGSRRRASAQACHPADFELKPDHHSARVLPWRTRGLASIETSRSKVATGRCRRTGGGGEEHSQEETGEIGHGLTKVETINEC
jgi:hypothetical protein